MRAPIRHQNHDKYKARIENLISLYDSQSKNLEISIESHSHNAKYLAVLVSGYLEQAIKELFLEYVQVGSRAQISKYIIGTWPISRNMSTENIKDIFNQFSLQWGEAFAKWLEEEESRKADINSLVSWRNSIAHGQESNTTGVTLVSVKNKFITIKSLVDFLENTLRGI